MRNYYQPDKIISSTTVWRWYGNLFRELEDDFLMPSEKAYMVDRQRNASEMVLVQNKPYFKHAFSDHFARAASFLLHGRKKPTILDLGCGVGTQSLFFGLMGARVIALDSDKKALDILEKRISFYQKTCQRDISISIQCVNSLEFGYSSVAPIHGLFSMFAFNIMQPSKRLISSMVPSLSQDALLAILDGNSLCWLPRVFRSRRRQVLSPLQLERELVDYGFTITEHRGGVSVPPFLWALNAFNMVTRIDYVLDHVWFFPASHLLMAERKGVLKDTCPI